MELDSEITKILLLENENWRWMSHMTLEDSSILKKKGRKVLKLFWKDTGQEQNQVQIWLHCPPLTFCSRALVKLRKNW